MGFNGLRWLDPIVLAWVLLFSTFFTSSVSYSSIRPFHLLRGSTHPHPYATSFGIRASVYFCSFRECL